MVGYPILTDHYVCLELFSGRIDENYQKFLNGFENHEKDVGVANISRIKKTSCGGRLCKPVGMFTDCLSHDPPDLMVI